MNTLRITAVALIAGLSFLAGCQSTSSSSYGSSASADASCPQGSGTACHTIRIRE